MFDWWDYAFMKRALVATTVLSFSIAPIGAFLVLRRMSLAGEAIAHAIVPGIVIAFIVSGLSVAALVVGGLVSGLIVALLSGWLARATILREDASLASHYLIALALGIFILSAAGSAIPLDSFLFGSILGIGDDTLILIGTTTTLTLISFALMLRPLIIATLDPIYYESQTRYSGLIHQGFMFLLVLNLLSGFKALGTLMAVGLMILPAASARYWTVTITSYLGLSLIFTIISCWLGLILSFYLSSVPSGPAIVIIAGGLFAISAAISPQGIRMSWDSKPKKDQ